MGFGIVEVITLLLSLAGFGITANPKAPTADQALEYAIPDADLVVHFDAGAVIAGNYKALIALADKPGIKQSPELAQLVREVTNQLEGTRGMIKTSVGLDVTTDLNDATAFVQFGANKRANMPSFIAVAHGKFTVALVDKVAALTHKPVQKIGAAEMIEVDADSAFGVTKSNVVVAGTPALVRDRLADSWKAPARGKDTSLGYAADIIAGKPVFAVMMAMSPAGRADVMGKLGKDQNFATDLFKRHKLAAFELYPNGLGWNWIDTKAGGVEQMQMLAEGVVEIFRAAQIAPRGAAKILLAGLESYRGLDKRVDQVLAQKANVMKVVDELTGDGKFDAKIAKSGANRLDVRLTGKSISEVVPFSLALPVMGSAFFVARKTDVTAMPPPAIATPPAQPAPKGRK